jgi:integrase
VGASGWIRRCATVLARALELARKRGLIDVNPARDAARPRAARSKPFAPTGDEVRELLAAAAKRDPEATDAPVVLASSGIRKGELLAIRWGDVDLDGAEVHVSVAISDGGGTGRGPQVDEAIRLAGCPAYLICGRRTHAASSSPAGSEYVFPSGIDGSVPMRPDALSNRWAHYAASLRRPYRRRQAKGDRRTRVLPPTRPAGSTVMASSLMTTGLGWSQPAPQHPPG